MAFSPFKVLKSLLIRQENSLTAKEVEIVPGGTASTKTTIQSSQTSNQTLTLPDATDTLIGKATSDVLTNKSYNAAGTGNVLSNVTNSHLSGSAAISNANLATMAANTAKANVTGGAAVPTDVAVVSTNTASAIVVRDGSGNFAAGTITAALSGNASTATTATTAGNVSGTVAIGNGGTGQTTKTPAFDALSPMTTAGDIIYGGASGTGTRLAAGTSGQTLVSAGAAAPAWGAIGIAGGGTGNTSLAVTAGGGLYTDGTKVMNAGAGTSGQYFKSAGASAPTWASFAAPTVQRFTSGTAATYTPTAGTTWIEVDIIGGGGGGGASGTAGGGTPGAGVDSTFKTSGAVAIVTAGGGNSGETRGGAAPRGQGGANTTASPATVLINMRGGSAGTRLLQGVAGTLGVSSSAPGVFGGNAYGGDGFEGAQDPVANSGCGGGGAGCPTTAGAAGGTGGGSGGYVKFIISSVAASYQYTVGTGGAGSSAGTNGHTGSAGATGIIIITEHSN